MGFLLKIAIFAVVVYVAWTAARRWLGLFGGAPRPPAPARREASPAPAPALARPVVIEDTRLCTVCGAYVSATAAKCGRSDCPQP
jgi:hypothetical protein